MNKLMNKMLAVNPLWRHSQKLCIKTHTLKKGLLGAMWSIDLKETRFMQILSAAESRSTDVVHLPQVAILVSPICTIYWPHFLWYHCALLELEKLCNDMVLHPVDRRKQAKFHNHPVFHQTALQTQWGALVTFSLQEHSSVCSSLLPLPWDLLSHSEHLRFWWLNYGHQV